MSKIRIIAIVVLLLVIGTALMYMQGAGSEWFGLGTWGAIASIVALLIYLLSPSKSVEHSSPSKTDMSIRQGGEKNRAITVAGNEGNISVGDTINKGVPVEHYDDKLEELFNAKKKVENEKKKVEQLEQALPSSSPPQPGFDQRGQTVENQTNVAGNQYVSGVPVRHYDDKLEELFNARKTIEQLEQELAQAPLEINATGQETPQPTQEARELARLITDNDGLYVRALKAIAEGHDSHADVLLDESQNLLNSVQEEKDRAQIKIYMARINNAYYAGRHRDALQWCDRLEPIAGDDSSILNRLGLVYYANAAYQKAEPLFKRSQAIREKALGPDHPSVAQSLNNLAALYYTQGDYSQAEPLYKRSLAIWEKALGPDHPDVAASLNNLAELYRTQGDYAQAEPLYKRALAIREKALGPDHPDVAQSLNNLAVLYRATERDKEALELENNAARIRAIKR